MPLIRSPKIELSLTDEKRKELLQQLENELAGKPSSGKSAWEIPLVFEMLLERLNGPSDRMDVLVVWDAFRDIRSEERTDLISDAYHERADLIVQALGATPAEALDQCLLPYHVMHMDRPGETDPDEMRKALLDEGAFQLGQRLELYLPTRKMAEAAQARLNERVPNGRWAIGEMVRS
jgi:hypothetical protein